MRGINSIRNRHIRENKVILRVREGSSQRSRLQAHSAQIQVFSIFPGEWEEICPVPNNHERVLRADSLFYAHCSEHSELCRRYISWSISSILQVPPSKQSWVLSFSTSASGLQSSAAFLCLLSSFSDPQRQ